MTSTTSDGKAPPLSRALILGVLGVVYGDIGTSPLYAFREALQPFSANGIQHEHVIGLISLMIWTLTIIVAFKYVLFSCGPTTTGKAGRCPCWRS